MIEVTVDDPMKSIEDACNRFFDLPYTNILFPDDLTAALSMGLSEELYIAPSISDEQVRRRHSEMKFRVAAHLANPDTFIAAYRNYVPNEKAADDTPIVRNVRDRLPGLHSNEARVLSGWVAHDLVNLTLTNRRNLLGEMTDKSIEARQGYACREICVRGLGTAALPPGGGRVLECASGIRSGLARIQESSQRLWSGAWLLHDTPFASMVNSGLCLPYQVRNPMVQCFEGDVADGLAKFGSDKSLHKSFEAAIIPNGLSGDQAAIEAGLEGLRNMLVDEGLLVVRGHKDRSKGLPVQDVIDLASQQFKPPVKLGEVPVTAMKGAVQLETAAIFVK